VRAGISFAAVPRHKVIAMDASPRGEPVHTRAQSVLATLRDDGRVAVQGSLLDLRTRGFLPLAGSMQGMGIIHHMEFEWVVDPDRLTVEALAPRQPTVAFEASPETGGECCRDPIERVEGLAGTRLADLSPALRERIGGALGCSHLVTLALFMGAAVRAGLGRERARFPGRLAGRRAGPLFRRDVVFDAHERDPERGHVQVLVRFGDLHWSDAPPGALAPERFGLHHELGAAVDVALWPGELLGITGRERLRTPERFTGVEWMERGPMLSAVVGLGLARGAAAALVERLGDAEETIPWRDALVMLPPALVQCRAAHPDAWHDKIRATPRHAGLTALPDSCYMWRRGGALEDIRRRQGAAKGGR
jgi:hypothetical protein